MLSLPCYHDPILKLKLRKNFQTSIFRVNNDEFMFVYLFVLFGVFRPTRDFSLIWSRHPFGDVTIAGEGLQILTYARNLWPMSSEGSLA